MIPTFKSVISLSGGIDSATTLAYAIQKDNLRPLAVVFNYGQTHSEEILHARNISTYYGIPLEVVDIHIPCLQSGLIKGANDTSAVEASGHPITWVPHRNLLMVTILASIAESNGIKDVYIGIQYDEGYPDTTEKWLNRTQTNFDNVCIHAPLVSLYKSDVVKLALQLNVPLELTRSCYSADERPCGECRSCVRRTRAFMANNLCDPAMTSIEWTHAVRYAEYNRGDNSE